MNDKKRGGFIPLIAIIIMGVVALAGGTVATVSIIKNKERSAQPAVVVEQTEERPGDTAIQRDTKTDSEDTASEPAKSHSPEVPKAENGNTKGKESVYQELIGRPNRPTQEEIEKKQVQVQAEYEAMNAALKQAAEDYQKHTQEAQIEAQKDKYVESSTYPIILSFEDNKGNVYKRSDYNGYSGPYVSWPNESSRTLRIGDTIRATVTARDSQGRALEYNWNSNSQAFNAIKGIENGVYKYTPSNAIEYTITSADLQSSGETFRLVWQIRIAGNTYYRFGGGEYDDSGFIDYKIIQ
jgi:hypothetical protein